MKLSTRLELFDLAQATLGGACLLLAVCIFAGPYYPHTLAGKVFALLMT